MTQQSAIPTSLAGLRELMRRDDERQRKGPPKEEAGVAERRAFIEAMTTLEHPRLTDAVELAAEWQRINGHGKPEKLLALDGLYASGKSSIAQVILLRACRAQWSELGTEIEDDEGRHLVIPAFLINIKGGAELELAGQLATAVHVPPTQIHRPGMTAGRILELAAQACRRSRTLVGVVDECQNLSAGRGRAMTGFLKSAFNELPVTLMFVGQGLDTTPLFKASSDKDEQQQAAAQLIERKIALEYGRLMEDDTGVKELVEIVRCVNRQLPLQEQPTLVGDDLEWLLRASAGNRGRTLSVLRMAALEAVGDEERFCRSSFERGAARIGISA